MITRLIAFAGLGTAAVVVVLANRKKRQPVILLPPPSKEKPDVPMGDQSRPRVAGGENGQGILGAGSGSEWGSKASRQEELAAKPRSMTDADFKAPIAWRRTWDDEDDFSADDPISGEKIGRFYQDKAGIERGKWTWFYHGPLPGPRWGALNRTGAEDTPKLAAEAIEELWRTATEGKVWDQKRRRWVSR